MKKVTFKVLFFSAALAIAGVDLRALPCSSQGGCADCQNGPNNLALCLTVNYDAHCNCNISAENRTMCLLWDECDYTGPGGGGGGGTGGGGGGTTCTRPAGGWCPAACTSCGTVYWY